MTYKSLTKQLIYILVFTFFTTINFAQTQQRETLQEGDLLFQNLKCGALCDAIKAVTNGVDGKQFAHCAMVVKINDTLKVVEAIGNQVQANSLYNFFKRSGDTSVIENITIARLKNEYKKFIAKASAFAKKQVGKPYDDEFIMNNEKWYCSELLYEAYKNANNKKDFFTLAPMTFKDPKTNNFFSAWVDYYKDLQKPIPEGKLGINPGLISRSKKIDVLKIDKVKLD